MLVALPIRPRGFQACLPARQGLSLLTLRNQSSSGIFPRRRITGFQLSRPSLCLCDGACPPRRMANSDLAFARHFPAARGNRAPGSRFVVRTGTPLARVSGFVCSNPERKKSLVTVFLIATCRIKTMPKSFACNKNRVSNRQFRGVKGFSIFTVSRLTRSSSDFPVFGRSPGIHVEDAPRRAEKERASAPNIRVML